MKISLAPLPLNYNLSTLRQFYEEVASSDFIDRIYLGEVFCSKRLFSFQSYLEFKEILELAGKEVVFSTYALPTREEDFVQVLPFIEATEVIEVNNLGFLAFIKKQVPHKKFLMGPTCSLYNTHDFEIARDWGSESAVSPFDLLEETVETLLVKNILPLEVPVYGRFPLAFSWRCYTALFFSKRQGDCELICRTKTDLSLKNLEGEVAFVVNGNLIESGRTICLFEQGKKLAELGAAFGRLYAGPGEAARVAELFSNYLRDKVTLKKSVELIESFKGGRVMFAPVARRQM